MEKKQQENNAAKFQNRLVLALFLTSAVIVIVLCLYTGIKLHTLSANVYKETEERLLSLSKYAATLVTVEELNELQRPEDMSKPLFGELRKRLIDFADSNDILYVYYYRNNSNNMVQPIVDNDLVDLSFNLSYPPFEWEEKALEALNGNAAVTELQQYSENFDNLISAFAPVYDSRGNVIAVAGVDIYDENILNIRGTMNTLVPLLSVGVLSVAICGLVMVFLQKKTDKERQKALEEALLANQVKTDFLANISHEMRTPLNAILGLSELVLAAKDFGEEERSSLEKVYSAGATLLSTVNDILDISKISAGKLELVPVEYDVSSLLNDTITQSIMFTGEKPIQFILDIDENLPARLYGDELRIKQMLNNLLSNAFKYTRQGTVNFTVSCIKEGDAVLITASVSDTGIGIEQKNISKIFEDYGQVDTKANRSIMGTGLGMPLSKRLLDLMGGTITVQSEYGKGSTFTVKFQQQSRTDFTLGRETVENLKKFHYSDNKRRMNSSVERIKLPYARILIVDDVITNLEVARGLMKPYRMKIDCLTNGSEAIDAVRAEKVRYNAIFMDHMMPGMDGIEAVQLIRKIGTEYAKNVPIIALTANALVGNEEMFLRNGFQSFLSKPIDTAKLDIVIREWVRNREQEQLYKEEHGDTEDENPQNEDTAAGPDLRGIYIQGLDVEKGISRYGGDKNAYISILRSFAANTPELLEKTKDVTGENLKDYTITVHGIKGSSRGINAEAIGNRAEALEKAGKAGDLDFITAYNPALVESVSMLIDGLNALFSKLDAENAKPKKDKPDRELLEKLMTQCENYEMDNIEATMKELESFDYEEDNDLTDWLRKNIQQMNYMEIKEKLKTLLNGN